MQKRIVLVLAILFIASIAVFAQDAAPVATSGDDLFASVDGNALTADEMNTVIGEGPQKACEYAIGGCITGAIGGGIGGALLEPGAVPGAIAGGIGGFVGGFVYGMFVPDIDPAIVDLQQQLLIQQAVIYSLCNSSGPSNDAGAGR